MNKAKVQLDRANKWYYCDCKDQKYAVGDRVIVASNKGLEGGKVIEICQDQDIPRQETLIIERLLTLQDDQKICELKQIESEVMQSTKQVANELKLEMKIVDVQISLDENKMCISFTSEDRVDFRELVKILASKYKKRIELRQIGSRDEVKIVGSIGPCGRVCCCNKYFNDFSHVTIKMAKVQNLALNPSNISGICGRLLCCLSYENEYYEEISKKMPKINSQVQTPNGKGKVIFNNLLKQSVDVLFDGGDVFTFPIEQIKFNNEPIKKEKKKTDKE